MRIRKKKNAPIRFERCAEYTAETEGLLERFYEIFDAEKPLEMEIGSGKGRFIAELAEQNPQKQFISIERVIDCLVMAMEKAQAKELQNIKYFCLDAGTLTEYFPAQCADVIYLNFSDPWPKSRYAKRRLTHRRMVGAYLPLLKKEGKICFKTDNRPLFDFSVEEFQEMGFRLEELTYDLHSTDTPNIMTEYEERFSAMGVPINRFVAYPTEKTYAFFQ
ncbi:MAG: tRNA (guanosine(46)-N7)-methyltransferase TrmB [Clostridia bacterium]|nr:tRNA (guanosine(46)-N7)-methyltransferase TrmB [Clostridia bacterium]